MIGPYYIGKEALYAVPQQRRTWCLFEALSFDTLRDLMVTSIQGGFRTEGDEQMEVNHPAPSCNYEGLV